VKDYVQSTVEYSSFHATEMIPWLKELALNIIDRDGKVLLSYLEVEV
jgi:hypothetical protein